MKKNKFKSIFLIFLVLLGVTSVITVFNNKSNNTVNVDTSSGLINDVNSSGIAILKKLESGVTSEGYPYQTYSYEITPEDTTFKTIKVKSLEYATTPSEDDVEVSEVLDVSINNTASTFTIVKKLDFDKQVMVTLCSEIDETVSSSLLIDCEQRWLGFNVDVIDEDYSLYSFPLNNECYTEINVDDVLVTIYDFMVNNFSSKYTLETDFSETLSYKNCIKSYSVVNDSCSLVYITEAFKRTPVISPSSCIEILNFNLSDDSHSMINSLNCFFDNSDYLSFNQFIYDCNQEFCNLSTYDQSIIMEQYGFGFKCKLNVNFELYDSFVNFDYDFFVACSPSQFVVDPSSLVLESNSIIF